jgi:hypothetical protein
MTLPVISAAHGEAIALVGSYSGPLAGQSFLVLIRFGSDGNWRVAGGFPISIS